MEKRAIGNSGLKVSLIGLGCNNFGGRLDLAASKPVIHKALDLGIDFFDTANIYGSPVGGSELVLGEVLGARRKDIVLATKLGKQMSAAGALKGGSRSTIITATEDSLRRLKTDWIDLMYMHDPDPNTPIEESLRALDDLIRQGKVRYIGCSNFAAWQLAEAAGVADHRNLHHFICSQDEYSLVARAPEKEMIPAMKHFGMGLIPYFPLASGLLTGKYKRDAMPKGARITDSEYFAKYFLADPAIWTRIERLEAFCAEQGRSMTELAFSWLAARQPVASIIAGATKAEQLEQNAKAAGWKLTAEDMKRVDDLLKV